MKLVTSWDDGHKDDIRLAELLDKYNIPAIFYLNNNSELSQGEIKELSKRFEIGGHTVSHPSDMKLLSDGAIEFEVLENKHWLEFLIGKSIKSFCYPRGRYDDRVVDAVKRAGYKEARTTVVMKTSLPRDKYRIATSAHVFQRPEYSGVPWLTVALEQLDQAEAKGDNGYYHLWGHSWEITRDGLWEDLESLLKTINARSSLK